MSTTKNYNGETIVKNEEKELTYVEFFAGMGVTSLALKRIGEKYGVKFTCKGISEFDKRPLKAYELLHGKDIKNYGDVTKIDFEEMVKEVGKFDICSWTSPCQSISNAGKKDGFEEGANGKSSLFWEIKRLFKVHKPKVIIMENVKDILNKRNIGTFNKVVKYFNDEGYSVRYGIFDASKFGIPHARERMFMVCTYGEEIDFAFPKERKLKFELKDIIEKDVDTKYPKENYYLGSQIDSLIYKSMFENHAFKVHNPSYATIATTITTNACRNGENFVFEKDMSKSPRIHINDEAKCGLVANGISVEEVEKVRIRTLTKREAMLLMGLREEEIAKLMVMPKTNVYFVMGNSIVVDALETFLDEYFKVFLATRDKKKRRTTKEVVEKKVVTKNHHKVFIVRNVGVHS